MLLQYLLDDQSSALFLKHPFTFSDIAVGFI